MGAPVSEWISPLPLALWAKSLKPGVSPLPHPGIPLRVTGTTSFRGEGVVHLANLVLNFVVLPWGKIVAYSPPWGGSWGTCPGGVAQVDFCQTCEVQELGISDTAARTLPLPLPLGQRAAKCSSELQILQVMVVPSLPFGFRFRPCPLPEPRPEPFPRLPR